MTDLQILTTCISVVLTYDCITYLAWRRRVYRKLDDLSGRVWSLEHDNDDLRRQLSCATERSFIK